MAEQESGLFKVMVPFGSAILIFLGVFYNLQYYKEFGISINRFLELSEMLLLFLNKLIILVGTLLFGSILAIKLLDSDSEHFEQVEGLKKDGRSLKWLWKRFFIIWMQLIPTILGWIYTLIIGNPLHHLFEKILITQITLFVIGFTFRIFVPALEKLSGTKLTIGIHNLLFSFAIALPIVYSYAQTEVYSVKYGGMNSNVRIETVNGPLVNDQKHYYIGNTRQYLFFYDQVANETAVYPMSDIKKISFGKPVATK